MSKSFKLLSNNIKNAQISKKSFIFLPKTSICERLLEILWDQNFILGYKLSDNKLKVFLKYKKNNPTIFSIKRLTKSGQKVYFNLKQIWKINPANSVLIFSTNKGFLTLLGCKIKNVGGELVLVLN